MTPLGIESHDLLACSAVPQPTTSPRPPYEQGHYTTFGFFLLLFPKLTVVFTKVSRNLM
jgi:hypothetical protein